MKENLIQIGKILYIIIDYKQYAKIIKGEIINLTNDNFCINTFEMGKNKGTFVFSFTQPNIFISDNKGDANLIFHAINFRSQNYEDTPDILESKKKYPELWI